MAERVLSVRLRAIVDGYVDAMGRAASATEKVAGVGQRMADAGKRATVGFTLPMAAAGGVAVKAAMDFESAFAGVRKTVDGTEADFAMLKQGITDMSKQLPSSTTEIAAVAEAAGQLGIETPNILGFTRTMIDLGNSTNIAATDAAMSLAQLATVTGMNQKDFGRLGSSIVAMGNNFETTESKIVEMSQRLAGAGKQVGLSEAEIVGLATAMSSVGVEAEMGGTAMTKIMMAISKAVTTGSADLNEWAKVAGMSNEQFSQLWKSDAGAGMAAMTDGLGRISAAGGDLFGTLEKLGVTEARAGQSLMLLAGAQGKVAAAMGMSESAWKSGTALSEEAAQRYATLESRLAMLRNRVTDVARMLGEALMPAVNGVLGVAGTLLGGVEGLMRAFTALPKPVQAVAGSMVALVAAAGPGLWIMGKLVMMAGPLALGMAKLALANLRGAATAVASARGMSLQTAAAGGLRLGLRGIGTAAASALKTMWPLIAISAAVAAAAWAVGRANKEMADRYMTSATAADTLASSVGLLTRELRKNKDESEDVEILSEDDFRSANEALIKMLRELEKDHAQTMVMSIAFDMRSAGNSAEDVREHVTRVAEAAGVEVPAELTLEGIGDFQDQLDMVQQAAKRAMSEWDPASDVHMTRGMTEELTRAADAAGKLWQNDQTAAWAEMLGVAATETENSADATNYLVDEMLRLTGVGELNTSTVTDLAGALDDMTSSSSTASDEQKEMLNTIREAAEGMDGGLTPANFALAASQYTAALSAGTLAEKLNGERAAAEEASGGLGAAQGSAEDFASALDLLAANAAFARMDMDAGAAAATAFGQAMKESSLLGERMAAGLRGGSAMKNLAEGMTGAKAIADIQKRATKENEKASKAIDRLGDAARRADPKLSAFQIRLDALRAASEAFTKSIDDSSMLDDQISSALSLGEAYRDFEKSARRLPQTLDLTAIATGKLRPRQAEAVQNMLNLGKAARDYLATLIELGKSDGEVAAEAAKLREEYSKTFREMGLSEAQIRQYLEAMGLLPEQVTTAIKVSGLEEARTKLDAYLQLLNGRIPPEVATSIIAQIESGDVEGAAAALADYARSNPALLEVRVDSDSIDKTQEQIDEVRAKLWKLPRDFDPLKAMLGEYTDEQQAAIDGVMQFGDAVQNYLSKVAHDGNWQEVRDQAYEIRDAFLETAGFGEDAGKPYDEMSESARKYLDLIGMSDWQIESAITLSGDADAMFRIQMYAQFMGETIPPEVLTEVMTLMDEGKLQEAADRLAGWRKSEESKTVQIKVQAAMEGLFGPDSWMLTPKTGKPRAGGGWIEGPGTSTSDSILTPSSRGEFMVRASSASKLKDVLPHINATGTLPSSLGDVSRFSGPQPSPSTLKLDDASLRQLAQQMQGGDTFQFSGDFVSPSPERLPRVIADQVGTGRVRIGRRR